MSKYGRLWEQIRGIREDLKEFMPGAKVDSLESAEIEFDSFIKEHEKSVKRIQNRLSSWKRLEEEMKDAE